MCASVAAGLLIRRLKWLAEMAAHVKLRMQAQVLMPGVVKIRL